MWLCPVCCLPPLTDSYFDTSISPSGGNSPLSVDLETKDVDEVEDAGDVDIRMMDAW